MTTLTAVAAQAPREPVVKQSSAPVMPSSSAIILAISLATAMARRLAALAWSFTACCCRFLTAGAESWPRARLRVQPAAEAFCDSLGAPISCPGVVFSHWGHGRVLQSMKGHRPEGSACVAGLLLP
ncbi:hypothetical protein AUW26_00135 [Streptomyces sp. CC71]|nr:hypothetical protein AUW26_00135 [Streptomyces sp. CC71]